jgi:hypothetical protein
MRNPKMPRDDDHDYNPEIESMIEERLFASEMYEPEIQPDEQSYDEVDDIRGVF